MFLGALALPACSARSSRAAPVTPGVELERPAPADTPAPPRHDVAVRPQPDSGSADVDAESERGSLIVEIIDRDADARALARTELRLVAPPREGSGRARTSELSARVDAEAGWREIRVVVHRERPGDERLTVLVERSPVGARGLEFRMEGTRLVDGRGALLGRVARPDGGETEIRLLATTDAS